MPENETEGGKGAYRQNQTRKRRDSQVIDVKATDVSGTETASGGDPAVESQQPELIEPETPLPQDQRAGTEEPVLFSQVLRSSSIQAAKPDLGPERLEPMAAMPSPDPAVEQAASVEPPEPKSAEPGSIEPRSFEPRSFEPRSFEPAPAETVEGTSPLPAAANPGPDPGPKSFGEGLDSKVFGRTPEPSGPGMTPPFTAPPARRSRAATILGAVAVILLLIIAGLLATGSQRAGTDDIRAALDAANGRIDALDARADPAKLTAQVSQLDGRASTFDADLASVRTGVDTLKGRLDALTAKADDTTARLAAMQPAAQASQAGNSAATGDSATPGGALATPMATATDLTALTGRVDDLAHRLDAVPPPATAPDLTPLQDQIAQLTQRLDALQALVAALPKVDLSPLDKQVGDLGQRIGDVDQGLSALKGTVAALPKVDLGSLDKQVGDLGQRIGDVDQGLSALKGTVAAFPKVDLEPLKSAIAATDTRLVPLESALSAPKAGEQATEARAVGNADVSRAAPLAVVAAQASRGIEDGRPIATEVDALRSLGVDDATLMPLSAIAEKGAPTAAALKAGWEEVEPQVSASLRPSGENDSLLARFTAGARQIVTVRRVGAPPGEDPASVAGRVSAALGNGDVAGALAEWDKLPEPGRGASQAWADAARARLDAQAAAKGLASGAIETLAKAKG